MTVQFPDFYGSPSPPDYAVRSERADPPAQAAPDSYTSGQATGFPLAVQPQEVGEMLGLDIPLDTRPLNVITRAIRAAQSDVQAYLGRPPVPATYTETGLLPRPEGWRLKNTPVLSVTTVTAETDSASNPTGRYTVVYVAGLDSVNDPELYPVVRYIELHALYDPLVQLLWRQLLPNSATRVTSGSTEGQSATITDSLPSSASTGRGSSAAVTAGLSLPGSPPAITTLDRWRLAKRRVYQRPTHPWATAPWPYSMPVRGELGEWAYRWEQWW